MKYTKKKNLSCGGYALYAKDEKTKTEIQVAYVGAGLPIEVWGKDEEEKKEMSYLECAEQEVEFDSLKFEHEGKTFFCSGAACHIVYKNDNGIGSYEFWGQRGNDVRIEWGSEPSEMTIEKLQVSDSSGISVDPSDEMLETINKKVFDYTHERAEENCE